MALPAARIFDICTGHMGFPPRIALQGSPDVFINSRAAHRQTDSWAIHSNSNSYHNGVLILGSATTFANGLRKGRVTDPISCGSKVATGSPNVFID
jgi:uncharacterized Zn-binding protein involved in type VI secretion